MFVRFSIFDKLGRDAALLVKFKKKATAQMFDRQDTKSMILVAVKYTGEIMVLNSNDGRNIMNELHALTPHFGPYYNWREFDQEKSAQDFVKELKSINLTPFIPKDPMLVKVYR